MKYYGINPPQLNLYKVTFELNNKLAYYWAENQQEVIQKIDNKLLQNMPNIELVN